MQGLIHSTCPETSVTQPDGSVRRLQFNARGLATAPARVKVVVA